MDADDVIARLNHTEYIASVDDGVAHYFLRVAGFASPSCIFLERDETARDEGTTTNLLGATHMIVLLDAHIDDAHRRAILGDHLRGVTGARERDDERGGNLLSGTHGG